MKKKYIVKKSSDFTKIIKESHFLKGKGFVIYTKKNKLDYSRFGISVSKKTGNAVVSPELSIINWPVEPNVW